MSQYPIPLGLSPVDKNKLSNYWPIRNKGNEFDWETVTGVVLSLALRKQMISYKVEDFQKDCHELFISKKLYNSDFWHVIETAYFTDGSLFKISPLFLLFKAKGSQIGRVDISAPDLRLCKLFAGLLGDFFLKDPLHDSLNFVEQELLTFFEGKLDLGSCVQNDEQPYLPFLNKTFREDIIFLASQPQYLLEVLPDTLKLYSFSYCAQLALNITDWQNEPQSKPLFFILDTEKASAERTSVKRAGYKLLTSACSKVFPLLSALDVLQIDDLNKKRPLWKVYQDILQYPDQVTLLTSLNDYLEAFSRNRDLPIRSPASCIEDAFEQFKELALEQFSDPKTTRAGVNKKYVKGVEEQIFNNFVQARGAAGRTLVLNQDQMLLLTNLTIGKAEKLRLHELRKGFEQRGFYLDNQSLQMLVTFYERMGNVERMSDSGDAVYVRKTL